MVIKPFIRIFLLIFIYWNKGIYACLRSKVYNSVSHLFYYMLFYDMGSYMFAIFLFSESVYMARVFREIMMWFLLFYRSDEQT